MYASLQFCGNIEEYFAKHTERLVVLLILPRFGNTHNIVRQYAFGKLVKEEKISSSQHIILYYFHWYYHYIRCLLQYFRQSEKVTVLAGHPISFLGMRIQKQFRKITYVYWVGDYFPGNDPINVIYRRISEFYHKQLTYRAYLSDRINIKLNGKVIDTEKSKTIMWGVKPVRIHLKQKNNRITLCFVGVIRDSQGIPQTLEAIAHMPNVYLKIIGKAPNELAMEYNRLIQKLGLAKRVSFPNTFLYGSVLDRQVKSCDIGVAFYDIGKEIGTYYADPAKIKTYTQYGLPVLMTDAADITKYVKRFKAGEIVKRETGDIKKGIETIMRSYQTYQKGVSAFNHFFSFEKYYEKKFKFLESV
jgi:hypothetical protein